MTQKSQLDCRAAGPPVDYRDNLRRATQGGQYCTPIGGQTSKPIDTFVAAAATVQPSGLPADFGHIVDGTAWDRTAASRLDGPLSGPQWQALRAVAAGPASGRCFRIYGGAFHLHPAPAEAGGEIAYEYVTSGIAIAASGAGRRSWEADDDRFALSEEIAAMGVKWRFKKAVGLAYDDDLNEYLAVLARAIARDGGRQTLRLDGAAPGRLAAAIPDGGFPGVGRC